MKLQSEFEAFCRRVWEVSQDVSNVSSESTFRKQSSHSRQSSRDRVRRPVWEQVLAPCLMGPSCLLANSHLTAIIFRFLNISNSVDPPVLVLIKRRLLCSACLPWKLSTNISNSDLAGDSEDLISKGLYS